VGEYTVKLSHLSYQEQTIAGVRVRLGQTTTLGDVRLSEQVYEQPAVEVSAKVPLIDPRSTETGGVLNTKEYSALPIERDYRSVATLLPQVSPSYLGDGMNVAGSTGLDNRFLVDGIDVTEPVRGATGTALPYNFVQEVEVRTGGYEAEYRSSLGGIVNAITYSGGNQVTGTAFGYYTRNRPTTDPRYVFQKDPGDFALYDVGFGLGGPVLRDRLTQLWLRSEAQRLTSERSRASATVGGPGPEGSIGKMVGAELNQHIYQWCMDFLGPEGILYHGYAMTGAHRDGDWRGPIQQRFLRSRANTIEGGTSEVMRNILGERVLGLPGDLRADSGMPWKEIPRG